jgi:23S rRNA pseudouridine955/2504/2580 synthase
MSQALILKQQVPKLTQPVAMLDYLAQRFTYKTTAEWSEQMEQGCLRLDGAIMRRSATLQGGEVLEYQPLPFAEPPVNTNYSIIHEDDDLLVVGKPAPIPMMSIRKYHQHSLLILLERDFPNLKLFPAHRLDMETTGVVIFAKNSAAASHMGKQFLIKNVHKTYLAWVHGLFPKDLKFLKSFLQRLPNRPHFIEAESGLPAETLVECLEFHNNLSLLELKPLTGRTHQLRVQLSGKGFPIVGDKRYTDYPHCLDEFLQKGMSESLLQKLGADRQLLHAWKISFTHPNGNETEFEAPLPEDFKSVPRAGLEPARTV